MSLTFPYREQLLQVPDPQVGFLVKALDELCAGLAALAPLAANVVVPYKESGTILTNSTGLPTIHQQCRAVVTRVAAQTIADVTVTPISFDTLQFGVGSLWNPALPTRVTVPVNGAGTYLCLALTSFVANAVGQRQVRITKNGTATQAVANVPAAAALAIGLSLSLLVPVIDGDYFGIDVYQDSGGPLNTNSNTQLSVIKLAAA